MFESNEGLGYLQRNIYKAIGQRYGAITRPMIQSIQQSRQEGTYTSREPMRPTTRPMMKKRR